jgi:hypothetical protein
MNFRMKLIPALVAVALSGGVQAASTNFDNFTALIGDVGTNTLPATAPYRLSSPNFSQVSIADRTTQLGLGQLNSGNWDMIAASGNMCECRKSGAAIA